MLAVTSRASAVARAPLVARRVALPARVGRAQLRATAEVEAKTESKKKKKEEEEEEVYDGPDVSPSTGQVQAFLNSVCETGVAQVELKLGNFSLKVRRSLEAGSAAAGPAPPAPAAAYAAPAYEPAAPAVTIITAGSPSAVSPYESIDEGLVYVTSPKVGIFRRGKYAAGKRIGKGDLVKDGDTVRSGQAIGFVEQLGTFVEVKVPQGGEVAGFKVADGEPVEYGQVVMELAPQFSLASPAT
ncbi:hypothetical protein Rsub_06013 [Raphidocelis subcapitata]|uniref:Lipoyl-binding domain-containing protein n=1 Tax=Raphidocelis subcapitata TaxID=307507 RepID=A0A2V0P078_9CHLO|nr:hypothetical protein Rsub_06013 [Raphidocelis subcapitata]|eukprot:GBF93281.1 hypothetical protein Rsub_06013 [Raphidocelis subcapitata]